LRNKIDRNVVKMVAIVATNPERRGQMARKPAHTIKVNRGMEALCKDTGCLYKAFLANNDGATTKEREDVRHALKFLSGLHAWWSDKRA
jgi:hypothetical protein